MKKIIFLGTVFAFAAALGYSAVTAVEGSVTVISASGETRAVVEGMEIDENDTIVTAAASGVDFELSDIGVFKVSENSRVVVASLARGENKLIRFGVSIGKAFFAFAKLGDRTAEVQTPTALAAVRGTSFVVESGEEDSRIAVLTGRVEVRNRIGERVELRAMEELRARAREQMRAQAMEQTRLRDLERLIAIRGIERIKDIREMGENLERIREQIRNREREAPANTDKTERIMRQLRERGLIDGDENDTRAAVKEMVANGGSELRIMHMLQTCRENNIRGDALARVMHDASSAMLAGMRLKEVNKGLALAVRENERNVPRDGGNSANAAIGSRPPVDPDKMKALAGQLKDKANDLVKRDDKMRMQERIRDMLKAKQALIRYRIRIISFIQMLKNSPNPEIRISVFDFFRDDPKATPEKFMHWWIVTHPPQVVR